MIINIESTPTIVQFKDGKEVARIVGLQEEDVYRNGLLTIMFNNLTTTKNPF